MDMVNTKLMDGGGVIWVGPAVDRLIYQYFLHEW